MNKEILRLALPSILANITVPLVGIVDLVIVGHISNASAIGGIAIGTMLFDLLYWNFGFLRVGTAGMTAQAFGRGNDGERVDIFSESTFFALAAAIFVMLIGPWFVDLVLLLVPCSQEAGTFAREYFNIRIWAAPATLSLMSFKGWFIGSQDTVSPMVSDIVVNVSNMIASYLLAVRSPLGAIGVAWGTVLAQYLGIVVTALIFAIRYKGLLVYLKNWLSSIKPKNIIHLASLNAHLFVRSLCFMVVYVGFTAITSYYGDDPLAVGAIMMKIFMIFSYVVDGFAYAGEALVGRYIGERSRSLTSRAVRMLFIWTLGIGLVFTLLYALFGPELIALMTSDRQVQIASEPFQFWLVLMPLVSCAAFMWDGIFVGATAGKEIRNCMIWSAIGFVLSYLAFKWWLGIQAVYLAYFVHLLARTVYLSLRWKETLRKSIPEL